MSFYELNTKINQQEDHKTLLPAPHTFYKKNRDFGLLCSLLDPQWLIQPPARVAASPQLPATLQGSWDLSSSTRAGTQALGSESSES